MSIRRAFVGWASVIVLTAGVRASAAADTPAALSLADAVRRAASDATPVAIAAADLDATEARQRETRSRLLPHLDAGVAYNNQSMNSASFGFSFPEIPGVPPLPDLLGPVDVYDARLYLTQPLVDIPAWRKFDAAGSEVEASRSENTATREGAAVRAARAYLDAARETARLAARRSDADLARELRDLAERQLQAGVATGIDVTRARAQEVTATSLLRQTEWRTEQAQIAVARALGLEVAARFALTDSLGAAFVASSAPTEVLAAVQLGLAQRADLQVVAAREQSARLERAAIRAERLPRIEFSANYGVNGPWDRTLATRDIEVGLALPLVEGRSRAARSDEQSARIRAAQLRSQDLRQQVEAEVRVALLELQSGEEQRIAAEERLRLAEEELAQARSRFTNGLAGNIEVIDAQSNLNHARDALIDAQYTAAAARIELARASGVAATIH